MEQTKPSLTENITKFYIRTSLKEVRVFKNKYISSIYCDDFFFINTFIMGITKTKYFYKKS